MLRALIVEDEPPSRNRLRRLLGAHADAVAVVGDAASADEAAEAVRATRPDVLFLDVQLPGGDGFALLDRLAQTDARLPHVVFVTAYAAYAVRAFEAEALDFLVKPVEPDRLAATVARLRARTAEAIDPAALARLADALRPRPPVPTALPVRARDGLAFVPLADVVFVEAKDKVTLAHTTDGREHLVDATLSGLATRLPEAFVQVSRSVIVHTLHLKACW